jgi:hypothetical protein
MCDTKGNKMYFTPGSITFRTDAVNDLMVTSGMTAEQIASEFLRGTHESLTELIKEGIEHEQRNIKKNEE